MEIQQKLLKFKFHILFTLVFLGLIISLIIFAPSFLTILAYFWPLFLSTALFLIAVIFFGKTSVPASDSHGDDHHKDAAEGLLDYVAGQPVEDQVQEAQQQEQEQEQEQVASVVGSFDAEKEKAKESS